MSLFVGAFSEQWDKKKTMLIADALAAAGTICILLLYITSRLEIWHIYLINSMNGFMNTVQRPAADVAVNTAGTGKPLAARSGPQKLFRLGSEYFISCLRDGPLHIWRIGGRYLL